MIKVKYNEKNYMIAASFERLSGNVVALNGTTLAETTGFKTYRMDGMTQLGDFSDYTTIYRRLDNAVQFSNDGSIWVEPPIPPEPEPVPYEPTLEERVNDLEIAICEITDELANALVE